jgi:hypothetical protein
VDRALDEMRAIGVDDDDAIIILQSAVSDAIPDQSNLVHVHNELEKRKKSP